MNLLKFQILRASGTWPDNSQLPAWISRGIHISCWPQIRRNLTLSLPSLWIRLAALRYVFILRLTWKSYFTFPYVLSVNVIWVSAFILLSCQQDALRAFMKSCFSKIITSEQSIWLLKRWVSSHSCKASYQSKADCSKLCLKHFAYIPLLSSFQKLNIPCLELEIPNIIRLILRHYEKELVFVNKVLTFQGFSTIIIGFIGKYRRLDRLM